jgi:hypothetical protein
MGGSSPKGKARGECASVLPGRYQNANQTVARQSKGLRGNKTENKTALALRFGTRHSDRQLLWWLSRNAHNWL